MENTFNVEYYPKYFNKKTRLYILQELEKNIEYYSKEQSRIKIYGKTFYIPRLQVAYGDKGLSYSFSGTSVLAKEWIEILNRIRNNLKKKLDLEFNFCLVNKYRDGNDYISYHKDDERDLGESPLIASLSFGASRDFYFKNENGDIKKYKLNCGDLLLIKHPTNLYWFHSVPKRKKVKDFRINLTFRNIIKK